VGRPYDREVASRSRLPAHAGRAVDSRPGTEADAGRVDPELIRYLVTHPGIGPGSRVLLCGISDAGFAQELTQLGLLTTCLHEEPHFHDSLQRRVPEAECCEGGPIREQFAPDPAGFDLVLLAVATHAESSSLYQRWQLIELASRLSCVRPGGSLVMLGQTGKDCGIRETHSLSCCLKQLSLFPGRCSTHRSGGQSRLRFARHEGRFAVSLQTPEQRMSPFEWDLLATEGHRSLPPECCQRADQAAQPIRNAA